MAGYFEKLEDIESCADELYIEEHSGSTWLQAWVEGVAASINLEHLLRHVILNMPDLIGKVTRELKAERGYSKEALDAENPTVN
jgi:hypothetical protein